MEENHDLKTLSGCLNVLRTRGYSEDFKVNEKGMRPLSSQKIYSPHDIKITNYYRFEGESDPSDMSILYAIETSDGLKGTLVDAYGPYASRKVADFISQVEEIHKKTNTDRQN